MKITENQIEMQILEYLNLRKDCFAFKVKDQVRKGFSPSKFMIRGVADIICLMDNGIVIFIEVKTSTGKQSIYQKNFELKVKQHGGNYIIARNLQGIKGALNAFTNNYFTADTSSDFICGDDTTSKTNS